MPTIKIVTIIENNPITGVIYGEKDIDINTTNTQQYIARQYQQAQTKKSALMKKRAENTKHK